MAINALVAVELKKRFIDIYILTRYKLKEQLTGNSLQLSKFPLPISKFRSHYAPTVIKKNTNTGSKIVKTTVHILY